MACKKTTLESGFTIERLEALEAAIAEGALRVKYSDKEIEYRSLKEMLKVRDLMRVKLGLKTESNNGIFGGKKVVARHSKGLDRC